MIHACIQTFIQTYIPTYTHTETKMFVGSASRATFHSSSLSIQQLSGLLLNHQHCDVPIKWPLVSHHRCEFPNRMRRYSTIFAVSTTGPDNLISKSTSGWRDEYNFNNKSNFENRFCEK